MIVQLLAVEINESAAEFARPLWSDIFLEAARKGRTDVVKLLLDEDNVVITTPDKHGLTPFVAAASNEYKESADLSTEKPRKLNAEPAGNGTQRIQFLESAMHTAVQQESLAMLQTIWDLGNNETQTEYSRGRKHKEGNHVTLGCRPWVY